MMDAAPFDPASGIEALIDELVTQGSLSSDQTRKMFRAVPRHLFVPARARAVPDAKDASAYPIDRDHDPDQWWRAVYSDTSIITQIDDGASDPATGHGDRFTSSNSAPGVVAQFLELLDLDNGHRVLEVGTGTGWTAGLLAACLGDHNVVTVEIDPALAETATKNLAAAGTNPRVVVGDGSLGHADGAPYDRVHATCAVAAIPYAWVEQTRPGGVILAPFTPGYGYGHKIRLDVSTDGHAIGRFVGPASYMMMRAHRHPIGDLTSFLHHENDATKTSTRIDPRTVVHGGPAANLTISTLVPGIRRFLGKDEQGGTGEETLWLLETHPTAATDGSWAVAEYAPGQGTYDVEQYGSRRLWDEVSATYFQWLTWGRPTIDRFGMTVGPGVQDIWLDTPDNILTKGV